MFLSLIPPENTSFAHLYLFMYIIHISIYGIHVTKQVKLKIQLEY